MNQTEQRTLRIDLYREDNGFSEWNSVTRLSVIVVAIVFVGIVSRTVTFTTAATATAMLLPFDSCSFRFCVRVFVCW